MLARPSFFPPLYMYASVNIYLYIERRGRKRFGRKTIEIQNACILPPVRWACFSFLSLPQQHDFPPPYQKPSSSLSHLSPPSSSRVFRKRNFDRRITIESCQSADHSRSLLWTPIIYTLLAWVYRSHYTCINWNVCEAGAAHFDSSLALHWMLDFRERIN